jgi:hypothetical protein
MTNDEYMQRLERQICDEIAQIQQRHQRELAPYFQRLSNLRALRPMPPVILHHGDIAGLPLAIIEDPKLSAITAYNQALKEYNDSGRRGEPPNVPG